MDDLLSEFLTETNESIDVVDVELVRLEQNPNDSEVLDNIFRLVHTIKGTCGFLGLPRLEAVAHSAENVLGKFRDGELSVTPEAVTLILASLDRIKELLAALEETEAEPDGDDNDLIQQLDACAEGEGPAAAPAEETEPAVEEAPVAEAPAAEVQEEVDPGLGRALKAGEVSLEELEAAFNAAPGPELEETEEAPSVEPIVSDAAEESVDDSVLRDFGGLPGVIGAFESALEVLVQSGKCPALGDPDKLARVSEDFGHLTLAAMNQDDALVKTVADGLQSAVVWDVALLASVSAGMRSELSSFGLPSDELDVVQTALERQAHLIVPPAPKETAQKSATDKNNQKGASNQSVRVNVDLLEDLMNLVSELVLTRNQLNQMVRRLEDSEFAVPLQRLSQCTTELQEGVMKTRMQPIGNAWSKLPRIVRDLSLELDKDIDLEMHGAETELDRQVLELIKDPLTHMVRNSADHGVEMPSVRERAGKSAKGTIKLDAYHEGGHIVITISDDGAGINAEKLRAKALENGLATEAELDAMSESQIQRFIFHAGLSTAQEVTSVSGRGVGMDVVRTNIEKIGGTVDMTSTFGKGTTFYIKIPLTLAIVSALIVESRDERFAIPQIAVLELVHADAKGENAIEHINSTPVFRLRNRLLPLVYLRDVLGFERGEHTGEAFIVVTQVGSFVFGIVVDQVFDTEEIVVKPVAPALSHLNTYSGNTILGDGSVIMILDPNGVASQVSSTNTDSEQDDMAAKAADARMSDRETMLVFKAGNETPKAVPLSLVARLEEIDVERIENRDVRPTVQYRGQLMPLLTMNPETVLREEGKQAVLVFTDDDHTMGIACDEILDIVESDLSVEISTQREGILGTSVIAEKVTEIIDVAHYSRQAFSDWFSADRKKSNTSSAKAVDNANLLVVEDSAFFRNMLRPLLSAAGYRVTVAQDAEEALQLRERSRDFDLIVSDIEMPGKSGFEMAQDIRAGGRWQHVPMIALSSLSDAKDFEKGRKSGFNDYVVKLDRDALLETITEQLNAKTQSEAA
ncbi:MAG: hybrid sensor histidine kinase/response regulator [Pseudomonadota bacterium]